MKFLYIFPHPDDESFGPTAAMHKQKKEGHEVHLLTLTRGEATKVRFEMGITEEHMADIRKKELESVSELLGFDSLTIMDFEDGLLAHYDPIVLETVIGDHIKKISPDILVTFPVHGISGHHDHITIHFIVKRLFIFLKLNEVPNLKRLAFFTLPRKEGLNDDEKGGNHEVNRSHGKFIDAEIELNDEDREMFLKSLDCYKTFEAVIEESGVKEHIKDTLYFELFGEDFDPPLKSLTELL